MTRLVGLVALAAVGCSSTQSKALPAPPPPSWSRTCLVLSVGAFSGMAHFGVLDAIKESGIKIDCIAGNSIGAVVAGMYATEPTADEAARYRVFADAYKRATEGESVDNGILGLVAGTALVLMSGGTALPVLAGGAVGGLVGASSVDELAFGRFRGVLNDFWGSAELENLPVPLVTWYGQTTATGVAVTLSLRGTVADAVAKSVANPLIFTDVDVRSQGIVDPGMDRIAAVPVEGACEIFPDARLIVSNVTDQPAVFTSAMKCPMVEIRIAAQGTPREALRGAGSAFDDARHKGYEAAKLALSGLPTRAPSSAASP